jgi:2-polyprenyl-3-methyl-5-hydroxy-6-metoxy-1,4-benzoquinol methylase
MRSALVPRSREGRDAPVGEGRVREGRLPLVHPRGSTGSPPSADRDARVRRRRGFDTLSGVTALLRKVKRTARAGLRRKVGIDIRRVDADGTTPAAEYLPEPDPETIAAARRTYSASFPISPSCSLSAEEIERAIRSYYWHYSLQFGDRLVQADWPPGRGLTGRHYRRYLHIFPALLSLTGGSLAGKTVVDVGCNCGFWSLQARLAGADRVLGIEASPENVEQARFVLRLAGLDGIEFEVGNAYELAPERHGVFDVAFYLGLLYHLEHPVLGLERLREVTRELAVVDTTVTRDRASVCRVLPDEAHEQNYSNRLRMMPSPSAVAMMLRHAGFRAVFVVPRTSAGLPPDYSRGARETFIALT